MEGYNTRNPAVKRLYREAQELAEDPDEDFHAGPLEDNLFEWHFTIRGPSETAFENGLYHGRIVLPAEYPMKPPNIIILTPNGRFETDTKICLSISGYHPETWLPSWSIRTALKALIGFMPTPGNGAIGSLDLPDSHRKVLAVSSRNWTCSECKKTNCEILPTVAAKPDDSKTPSNADSLFASVVKLDHVSETATDIPPAAPLRLETERASGDARPESPTNGAASSIRPRTSSLNNRPGRGAGKRAHFADEPSPTISPAINNEPYSFPPRPPSTTIPEYTAPSPSASSPTAPALAAETPSVVTTVTSGTDLNEMRQRQAAILAERKRVLRERLSHAQPVVAHEMPQQVGVFGITDTNRMERMVMMMRQIIVLIVVSLLLILLRRVILVLGEDEMEL